MKNEFIFNGIRICQSYAMVEAGKTLKVKRKWFDRLFGLPWNPFKKHVLIHTQKPRQDAVLINGVWFMHPLTFRRLKNAIDQQNKTDAQHDSTSI